MKSFVCYAYWSLLMISLISSCMLFMIVASESSKIKEKPTSVNSATTESLPVNFDDKKSSVKKSDEKIIFHAVPVKKNVLPEQVFVKKKEITKKLSENVKSLSDPPDLEKYIFLETVSKNSGVTTDGLSQMTTQPSVITLLDGNDDIKIEETIEKNIQNVLKNRTNLQNKVKTDETTVLDHKNSQTDEEHVEPVLIAEEGTEIDSENVIFNDSGGDDDNSTIIVGTTNLTVEEHPIPVFSEWAQKKMEEAEIKLEQEEASSSIKKDKIVKKKKVMVIKSNKQRSKNYASPDCGAKIIAANSEADSTHSVLSTSKDEYLLSPCTSRIWFVVELCEAIRAEKIELANFELFSSSPKEFTVAVSNRFPTRDWSTVGQFTAKDERDVQKFDLHPHLFGKFVRVDLTSHYSSEHFCPVSLFRVYGTSEFEAFETENQPDDFDDDDDDDDEVVASVNKNNLFKSASDAVMSIVKKAAEVLVKSNGQNGKKTELSSVRVEGDCCSTPSHVILCENCSDKLFTDVNRLISCKYDLLKNLLNFDLVRKSVYKSQICANFVGVDFNEQLTELRNDYISNLYPISYTVAMCNVLAVLHKKVGLNQSYEEQPNEPISNLTIDEKITNNLQPDPFQLDPFHNHISEINLSEKNEEIFTEDLVKETEPIDVPVIEPETTTIPVENPSTEETKEEENDFNIFNNIADEEQLPQPELVEISKEIVSTTENDVEANWEQIDNVLIETNAGHSNGETVQSNGNGLSGNFIVPSGNQKVQSESVFLRLSNRLKSLERNMSLSGQYLEELSRRYKKQVEELQHSFAKTITTMDEQNRERIEHSKQLFEQNAKLRQDLEELTEHLYSWKTIFIYLTGFICIQIVIFYTMFSIFIRKLQSKSLQLSVEQPKTRNEKFVRRKSVEGVFGHVSPMNRKKRPSEEALNITGTYEELLIVGSNSDNSDSSRADKKRNKQRNRKNSIPNQKRASSVDLNTKKVRQQLFRNESAPGGSSRLEIFEEKPNYYLSSHIEEVPALDDNEEMYMPGADLAYNEFMPDGPGGKKNGTPPSTKLVTTKTRRLSSPAFFKSALSRKKTPHESTGWEWYKLKKSSNNSISSQSKNSKQSKSESPEIININGFSHLSDESEAKNETPVIK